jgi:hypothetical protein
MSFALGWLFFCVVAAMFASIRRDRNPVGWFFVALFFSPLVAFILLLVLDNKPIVIPPPPPRRVDQRWQNLRAGVDDDLETAVQAEAMQSIRDARRRQQDRQAIIGAITVVVLIIGVVVIAAISA